MKEVIKYQCERCNKVFDSLFDCESHEETHEVPNNYIPRFSTIAGPPSSIDVIFPDGTITYYKQEDL